MIWNLFESDENELENALSRKIIGFRMNES